MSFAVHGTRGRSFTYHERKRLIRFPRNRENINVPWCRLQSFSLSLSLSLSLSIFFLFSLSLFEAADAMTIVIFRALRAVRVKETRKRDKNPGVNGAGRHAIPIN